jgi:hypothetical protein
MHDQRIANISPTQAFRGLLLSKYFCAIKPTRRRGGFSSEPVCQQL